MKLTPECYSCLRRLISQAIDLATDNASLKKEATKQAMEVLDTEFSYDQVSIVVATKIHDVIRNVTGNPDPYRAMKEKEMEIAQELYLELSLRAEAPSQSCEPKEWQAARRQRSNIYKNDFLNCLKLAAAANAIDFFKEPSLIKEDMRKPINFVLDDSGGLEARLKDANKVLYLADNAGEIYFDLPLVKWTKQFANVIYAVKPSPVQNDATMEDIKRAGLEAEFGTIITTGVASPGVVFSLASDEFRLEFESADLIFAKGMGHYEALSELPKQGRFFYCLMAKCKPVADSLGVPVNSYVAMMW